MSKWLIPLFGFSSALVAAQDTSCAPEPGAPCYPDDCERCYCLGPENIIANAPACPVTCDGDFRIEVAGMYWQATQDGLEYAIDNRVRSPDNASTDFTPFTDAIRGLNNLIDAEYETPHFKWDWGFKLGLIYCSPCDGWDIGVHWTWFQGRAHSHIEAELDDNHTLLPLWSAFASRVGLLNFSSDIEASWKAEFNLVDIELGRKFWTSRYLAVRPHVGLRVAFIDQDYNLHQKGGSFGPFAVSAAPQDPFNNTVDLANNYEGVGVRAGLDTTWSFGCGWALFGEMAASIIYGRFNTRYNEQNRLANHNHAKMRIAEIKESFRASRSSLDMALGLEWGALICDCKYGINVALAWEQHLFFHQNQLWRVTRLGDNGGKTPIPPNDTGENDFEQVRGTLTTQGVTLKLEFAF